MTCKPQVRTGLTAKHHVTGPEPASVFLFGFQFGSFTLISLGQRRASRSISGRNVAHWERARPMKTYNFKIVMEPDGERWLAYCPALVEKGGATWGHTKQEALKNIQEVVQMVVESLVEHGEALPTEPADQVQVSGEPQVAVVV